MGPLGLTSECNHGLSNAEKMSNPYYPITTQQKRTGLAIQVQEIPLQQPTYSSATQAFVRDNANPSLQIDPQMASIPYGEQADPNNGEMRKRGRKKGQKMRRRHEEDSNIKDESATDEDDEGDDFNMEGTKTKYGRKVHRPLQFVMPDDDTPIRRRRAPHRKSIDARLCKMCQRGHSPKSNKIVFCDGCNQPYHQLCHTPPIDDMLIEVEDAEWFCRECESKRTERVLKTGMSGQSLTENEKKTYLANLSLAQLVDLLFFCEEQHPDLEFYSPDAREIVDCLHSAAKAAAARGLAEETARDGKTKNSSSYPAPGHGIQLPSEEADLGRLVDQGENRLFSIQVY